MPDVKVNLFADYQRLASEWARSNVLSGNLKIKDIGKQQDRIAPWLQEHSFGAAIENMHQRIEPRPRKVLFCKDFIVPDDHKGEVESILELVKSGGDLTQFLGKNIRKLGAPDMILNFWGIFHFHMKPFSQRIPGADDNLLFAYVTDDTFYVVGFGGHERLYDTGLIKTLQMDFPQVFPSCSEKPVVDIDSDAYANLCKGKVNAIVSINGVACPPVGGGVNSDGESTKSYCETIVLHRTLDRYSEIIKKSFLSDIRKMGECYVDAVRSETITLRLQTMVPGGIILECPEGELVVSYRITKDGLSMLGVCAGGRVC